MSGTRILVVDDEPQILRALQLKLRSAGYAVESAATAGEALVKASMRPPEAIILDVLLPDGRGTDVCRELRTWSAAPILVLSAVGEEAEKIAALRPLTIDTVKGLGVPTRAPEPGELNRLFTPGPDVNMKPGELVASSKLSGLPRRQDYHFPAEAAGGDSKR